MKHLPHIGAVVIADGVLCIFARTGHNSTAFISLDSGNRLDKRLIAHWQDATDHPAFSSGSVFSDDCAPFWLNDEREALLSL